MDAGVSVSGYFNVHKNAPAPFEKDIKPIQMVKKNKMNIYLIYDVYICYVRLIYIYIYQIILNIYIYYNKK